MKVHNAAILGLLFVGVLGSSAFAQMNHGDGECSNCSKAASPEPFRKFQQDTLDLRQQLMNRRFDLQRENLKPVSDKAKMDALRTEIAAIKNRIIEIRSLSGLPETGMRDGECGVSCNDCTVPGAMKDCGSGPCGKRPCSQ